MAYKLLGFYSHIDVCRVFRTSGGFIFGSGDLIGPILDQNLDLIRASPRVVEGGRAVCVYRFLDFCYQLLLRSVGLNDVFAVYQLGYVGSRGDAGVDSEGVA